MLIRKSFLVHNTSDVIVSINSDLSLSGETVEVVCNNEDDSAYVIEGQGLHMSFSGEIATVDSANFIDSVSGLDYYILALPHFCGVDDYVESDHIYPLPQG